MIKLSKWIKEVKEVFNSFQNFSWKCVAIKYYVSANQIIFNTFHFILFLKQSVALIYYRFQEKILIKIVAVSFYF